jgi:hypothetical protein
MNETSAMKPLRARINQMAHAAALRHEERLRASLLARLLAARESGASFAELAELVDELEDAPAVITG